MRGHIDDVGHSHDDENGIIWWSSLLQGKSY